MAFAGFDRADCPPLDMMSRLKKETNLNWCGFYLPAPSQPGRTWIGKRAALVAQGWGLAPIFVGQEITGPGSHNTTLAQGTADGARACKALAAEGFPPGSWVYLDLENGPPFTVAQQAYVGAWVDAVEAGGYGAGVYCSFLFAAAVHLLRPSVRIWVFHVTTVASHVVAGNAFPSPNPVTSGYPAASIWQRDDSAVLTAFGDLLVDLDVSIYQDPGAPAQTSSPAPVPVAPTASLASAATSPPTDALARRKWIQAQLNAHGASPQLDVDGDLGPMSEAAIADFIAAHAA